MAHHIQIIGDAMLGGQGRETRAGKVRLTYIATWPRSFPSTVAPPISSTKLLIAMARRIVGALGCSRRTPCPKSYLDCHTLTKVLYGNRIYVEKWVSDSDSDETDEEELKV